MFVIMRYLHAQHISSWQPSVGVSECQTSDHRCAGMELYPRIGSFDIKTWTNCRMGMMSWAVLILCYAAKQRQLYGSVADSMLVSVFLLELYIFKFFLCVFGPAARACHPHASNTISKLLQLRHLLRSAHVIACRLHRVLPAVLFSEAVLPLPRAGADTFPALPAQVGDGVLGHDGHHARPRGVLHLLGLPRVGAVCVHLPGAVPDAGGPWPHTQSCAHHSAVHVPVGLLCSHAHGCNLSDILTVASCHKAWIVGSATMHKVRLLGFQGIMRHERDCTLVTSTLCNAAPVPARHAAGDSQRRGRGRGDLHQLGL